MTDGKIEEKVLRLPDGNIVVVGEEATAAPELLFKPELVKKKYSGLHELVKPPSRLSQFIFCNIRKTWLKI